MKKVISLFLSVAMLLSIVSVVDFSAFADVKTGKCGDNVTYSLDTETGVLTISGTGKMTAFSRFDSPFYYNSSVKTVIIENGVTSIGDYAFEGCTRLTSITIPDSVTSIGSNVILGCTSLTSIEVSYDNENYSSVNGVLFNKDKSELITYPAGKTDCEYAIPNSVISIGDSAFENCGSLTSVTIPDSVISIGNSAFSGCTSLASITIPDSVTSIGKYAFFSCISLVSVTIPNSVTSIGNGVFFDCENLVSIEVANDNMNYTSISGILFSKNKTELIQYPAAKTDSTYIIPDGVTRIDYAFGSCKNLTSVTIPDSVTSIGDWAFYYCTSLINAIIPDSVTSIGNYAFPGCTSLTSVTIPNSVTSIGSYAFDCCISLTSVTIPDSVTSIGDYAFDYCTSLTSVTIPDGVTSIGKDAFCSCTSLTSVTIPDSVISIGDHAFNYCTSLTSVTIPDSVTSIGKYAFYGCYFTSDNFVNDSNVEIDGYSRPTIVDSDDDGFCIKDNRLVRLRPAYAIGKVTIPNSIASIGRAAFEYCTSLTSVTIPNSVTSIGNQAFNNCTSLASVTIPDSVTDIGYLVFSGCVSLKSIEVSKENQRYISVDGVLFNKDKTELITYPAGKTDSEYVIPNGVTSIGNYAFENCKNLTNVAISNSVTSIDDNAFYNCKSLTSVTIPDSVTSIGSCAFDGCTSLKDIYYTGTQDNWNKISVSSYNECLKNVTIHYNFEPCIENQHNYYGEWKIIEEPTCTKVGLKQRTCSFDGYVQKEEIPAKGHTEVVINGYAATCEKSGLTDGKKCSVCGEVLEAQKEIPAKGHTEVIINGYAATCESTGLTDGKKCSVCGEVLEAQKVIPATGHTEKLINEKDATCTSTGYTGDKICTICNKILEKGKEIAKLDHTYTLTVVAPTCTTQGYTVYECKTCDKTYKDDYVNAKGHTEVIDKAVAATCTQSGLTEGKHCSVCNAVLVKQEKIDALGHKVEDVKGVQATCTKTGLTAGSKCSVCGEVLEAQKVIPATGHTEKLINEKAATCTSTGYTGDKICTNCNEVLEKGKEIAKLDHSYIKTVVEPTCTEPGYTIYKCKTCGDIKYADFVNSKGHTEVIDKAVAATCTQSGLTEGKHCSVCNAVLVKQEKIDALGHNFSNNAQVCLNGCGEANPNYVAPTQPNQNDTNTSNDEDVTVTSKPKSASIKKAKGKNKAIELTWGKVASVSGYEIQIATDKKFKKNKKTVNIKKQKTTKTTVKKLKAKKKYYVRVRTYKIVNGKKVYQRLRA